MQSHDHGAELNQSVATSGTFGSKLLSDKTFLIAIHVNVIVATSVGVIGSIANVLNILTFIRQGFKETVNVSLTALAVTDMASLICLTWMSTCYNPRFQRLVSSTFDPVQISYLTGAIPRSHFMLMGSWITAVIASERCACVTRPLEVKYILTRSRLVLILAVIFFVSLIPTVPLYYSTRLRTYFHPGYNKTQVGIAFTDDRPLIDDHFSGVSVAIFVSAFVIVTLSTVVIIWTLVSQSKWRAAMMTSGAPPTSPQDANVKTANDEGQAKSSGKEVIKSNRKLNSLSPRDRKAATTVSIIAAMFVVCYFPGILNLLVMVFVPDFNTGGRYSNAFQFFWSVSHTAEAICSSANIIVYIKTSTNFRITLMTLFNF